MEVLRISTGGRPRALLALALLCALLVALALRPASPPALRALDASGDGGSLQQPERADENFTGSAFFFAQDAFTPDPQLAREASAHVWPLARAPHPAATPLVGATPQDRYRALTCLTAAVYYEAANEPDEGQRAVAQVVLNRVRHPLWPNSVCGVVYQGSERSDLLCQFSFACDGSLVRLPMNAKWARAQRVASAALAGESFAPVGTATYYHTLAVRPGWAARLDPVAVVGAHIFYTMRGGAASPSAFSAPYARREPLPGPPPDRFALPASMKPAPVPPPLAELPVFIPEPLPPPVTPRPAPAAQPRKADADSTWRASLPESTVRAEYRNSGRPLP